MAIKVGFIGAGSIGFTRTLVRDLLTVPELQDTELRLMDISGRNLEMVAQLLKRDIKANNLPAKIVATTNRRKALEGCKYVVNCTRIGGLEAFKTDVEIPLKYGVDQCVGDTLCAGGIMYGQRNIPQILAFCKDIKEVSATNALFLNYANPNAMNTWAMLKYGGVNGVGLCHGVEGGWYQIISALALYNGDYTQKEIDDMGRARYKLCDIICAGINHQTWYVQIIYKGRKIGGAELLAAFEAHPGYSKTEKVRIDILRRFGYYSTESNGHLSEYVPWYRKNAKEIRKWIDLSDWINGETGGYLRCCTEGQDWFRTEFSKWMKEAGDPITPAKRGGEHGSYIIEALETGRTYRGHFNVRNNGCITNLPDDAIIEAPCYVDRNGISVPQIGDLPLGCAAVCNASISVQRLSVEAAVHGNVDLLKQAMMMDPLVSTICTTPEIWQMTDEMLIAGAKWLPQYAKQIPAIRRSFAKQKKLGTRSTKGAARIISIKQR